ncbi:MAG TPA: hypothetical protein ENN20_03290 [Candidatus Marinimicrobia bacterium]|nr:hypothetical protein [Candidatus Neomarinimicrobiota bacterium]
MIKNQCQYLIKSEAGSALASVLIFFLITTIIGMSLLSMASQEITFSRQTIQKIQSQYYAESGLSIAIWRMNQGADHLAAFSTGFTTVEIDTNNSTLTATGTAGSQTATIAWQFYADHPFNHILSYSTSLDTSNFTITSMGVHDITQFSELPTVDLNYYYSIADYRYTGDQKFNSKLDPGIHYVVGHVDAGNGTYLDGTLIATDGIKFTGHVTVNAQMIPDTNIYYPALVATDTTIAENDEILGNPNLNVNGAIYSTGYVSFMGEMLTGPIIAPNIELKAGVVVDDLGNPQYYTTPPGFSTSEEKDFDKFFKHGTWTRVN